MARVRVRGRGRVWPVALAGALGWLVMAGWPAIADSGHDGHPETPSAAASERASAWPPDAADMDQKAALARSQAAVGGTLRDAVFTDHRGREVRLSELRGKPLVVSFIYTSCSSVCPTITQSLAHSVDVANEAFGTDAFHVLTVGFDTSFDTPEAMRRFATQQGVYARNWRFLSGDLMSVLQLADDLGFSFFRSPKGFDHLNQVSLVDGEGTVRMHIYGDSFDTPRLVEPLKNLLYRTGASVFTAGGLIDSIKLFCTIYDPQTDRYRFDYSIFISMVAGITVMAIPAVVVVRSMLRARRDRRARRGGRAHGRV